MKRSAFSFTLALVLAVSLMPAAQAQNWSIKTGSGDEITIKNGIFGNKSKVVKDRLGNKYESSRGLFGGTGTEVSLLGNTYSTKKGLFGTREIEAQSILGDSIKTKKGWLLGRRTTTVDARGVTGLIGAAIKGSTGKKVNPLAGFGSGNGPDISTFGSQSSSDLFAPQAGVQPEQLSAPPAGSLDAAPKGNSQLF